MADDRTNVFDRGFARLSAEDVSPDCETAELVNEINEMLAAPRAPTLSPLEAGRDAASAIFQAYSGPPGETEIDEIILPEGEGVRTRLYKPQNERSGALVVYMHGGGWMFGSLDDYDALLSRLAARSGAGFISLDYRLSPENRFPAALDDCRRALYAISDNADAFNLDPARLAVMGDSAGGNLAAVLAQESVRSGPAIAAQFLLYPMLDISSPHRVYPSRIDFGDGDYFLTRDAIDAAAANYLGDPGLARDPRVSPLLAENFAGAPPAYILVGACDPLRDEARAYAARLADAGATVEFDCAPGAIHAVLSFGFLQSARRAETRLADAVRRMLKP
ncbi:MAG: alpha/beta hydrolase [Parvularculaceae bacterium]|nr:alpha/beta hydrolase [Parvularculaceae bacterium]